jgi:succinyl-CoA synthetase beta subunit
MVGRILAASRQFGEQPPPAQATTAPATEVSGSSVLDERESLAVVARLGLPVPTHEYLPAHELHGTATSSAVFEAGPFVVKAVIPHVHHKSDLGGVRVNVNGYPAIVETGRAMLQDIEASSGHVPEGVIVMQQVKSPGPELILHAQRDPAIGAVITVGAGGIFTEILRDVQTFVAPATVPEVRAMLANLRVWPLFNGFRGAAAVDTERLAQLIAEFSIAFVEDPTLTEVEVNPLMTSADQFWAVDAIVRREGTQK